MTSMTTVANTIEIIDNSYIDFHTKYEEEESTEKTVDDESKFLKPFEDETQKFGILIIKINDTPMISKPQYILFMLDRSQSMNEQSEDKVTKMEHAKHTIKNIVKLMVNLDETCPPVFIEVYVFDDEVEEVIPKTQVTKENMEEINKKINSIEPRNSTNIEAALQKSREIFQEVSSNSLTKHYTKTHIFLTDGLPTDGETNIGRLVKKELNNTLTMWDDDDNSHVFIGYGEDHNGNLLQSLSFNKKNGYYYFVDKIENSGLVFGEIIHGTLYNSLKNVNIALENGEIYNYKTNTWGSNLYVSSILSEAEKIYHVRSKIPNETNALLSAENAITNKEYKYIINRLPELIDMYTNKICETDLTPYILRQKTQEYLYNARSVAISIENASSVMIILARQTKKEVSDKIKVLREEIKSFLEFLKQYIKHRNLQNDKFYTMLYEDMYIAYKTFGTEKGAMYSGSRQSSQGRQASYTVSSQIESDCEFNDIETILPTTTLNNLSLNTTPKQLKVMRCLSNRTPSPPIIPKESIRLEDFKPLTEMDSIMLFNRRNVIN
jgi:translation initiation factor 2B subunit (eIF-2B alpha/beta/delta family)